MRSSKYSHVNGHLYYQYRTYEKMTYDSQFKDNFVKLLILQLFICHASRSNRLSYNIIYNTII
jgi:hypothetical protein